MRGFLGDRNDPVTRSTLHPPLAVGSEIWLELV